MICSSCDKSFEKSIDDKYCQDCRLEMWPCLECNASNEYQASNMCLCSGDKDNCHASEYLL